MTPAVVGSLPSARVSFVVATFMCYSANRPNKAKYVPRYIPCQTTVVLVALRDLPTTSLKVERERAEREPPKDLEYHIVQC